MDLKNYDYEHVNDNGLNIYHNSYIEETNGKLALREQELAQLKDSGSTDVKRIAKLEEIIKNMKSNIELVKMYQKSQRPYGL